MTCITLDFSEELRILPLAAIPPFFSQSKVLNAALSSLSSLRSTESSLVLQNYTPLSTLSTMTSNRQYDLVLLGPTGYTGKFCAEHIVQNLPTDLKWAIAGRSAEKMEPIAKELKALDSDRADPGT